jgi:CSLREA domain-containing protein
VRAWAGLLAVAALVLIASPSQATAARAATGRLKVTTTRDEFRPHDGRCSLREAIAAANSPGTRTDCGTAGRRSSTIILGAGRYVLSIRPRGADDNTSGDLNLVGRVPLTIIGAGPNRTIIDARGLGDRVIEVLPGARLKLIRLRIAGGRAAAGSAASAERPCAGGGAGAPAGDAADGGGILNQGTLVLNMVLVSGNAAGAGRAGGSAAANGCAGGAGGQGGSGGGIYNRGRLTVDDSTIRDNRAGTGGAGGRGAGAGGAGGSGGSGGGIYSQGRLSVIASTLDHNGTGSGGPGGSAMGPLGAGGDGAPGGSGAGILEAQARLTVVNSTVANNFTGPGGDAGFPNGSGGQGGSGGGVAVLNTVGLVRNGTVAGNVVGGGGLSGPTGGAAGSIGLGAGLFVRSGGRREDTRLENTIVAENEGSGCAGNAPGAIANVGHDLSYGNPACPGRHGNPKLGPLGNNGGPTQTMALGKASPAINRVPRRGAGCPPTDQRGVRRPQGKACDIGSFEFATPKITILAPFHRASYQRGARIVARFRCGEGGIASVIVKCHGTVARGHRINTDRLGSERFVVTSIDRSGNRTTRTIHYRVWAYVNPLRQISGLTPRRIDMGVDYAGWGPILALGAGRVTMASDTDSGPQSCWAISCWPGGGIVVYRLLDGPFAGKYVYVAEHLTVSVHAGEIVRPGQRIATLYSGYPWSEFGWAAGPGPEALAMADGHECPCSDPGDWSTIEGRNFNQLLVDVGAPSGLLQPNPPNQSMPSGWPSWSG